MTTAPTRDRIALIDILRGFVIVLMALDHTREFTNDSGWAYNALGPEAHPLIYATRWITHLCAPTFVLLAGVSIRLQSLGGLSPLALSSRILKRGLWLVFLEFTLIGFVWSFSIPFLQFWQVIWAIGWSMVLMAGLVFAPPIVSLIIGAAIVTASSALSTIPPDAFGPLAPLWQILHRIPAFLPAPPDTQVFVVYPILPWFGLMAIGYGIAPLFRSEHRDRNLIALGLTMLALFLALRLPNLYGDPRPWSAGEDLTRTLYSFFDVTKNPPSLSFALVTLGMVFVAAPGLARLPKPIAGVFRTFGAVPLFAYIAHIAIMHLYAILVRVIAGASLSPMTDTMRVFVFESERFEGFSLPLWATYLTWFAVIATLYPLCRWWLGVKQRRKEWWMAYL
ncbi:MAG TPA: heparan-alpha-glucosaminide N-acetyltransferase domain-containing protein [Hyphomonadaceae bacterium]|nr:heparan-alpha-glucosaminide N-acetyltransferase domain-containing protein [Hyphomonadaceae bacterium]